MTAADSGDDSGTSGEEENTEVEEYSVNSIVSVDEDGRKQTALFLNETDGPRGGLKVMLKEFPAQHAVQIVLTTLQATPSGLDPVGVWVNPDEVEQWAEQAEQEEAERERERAEAESNAIDPSSEDSDSNEEGAD